MNISHSFLPAKRSVSHISERMSIELEEYIQKTFNMQEIKLKAPNLLKKIDLLLKNYKNENLDIQADSIENKFLLNVNSIIEDNLSNSQFSIEFLSQEIAMSNSQLYRKILGLTGKSIVGYINSYRLTMALGLIKQGESTIKEIAYKVGYNDHHYFSRAFKQEFGKAPSFYRPKANFMAEMEPIITPMIT